MLLLRYLSRVLECSLHNVGRLGLLTILVLALLKISIILRREQVTYFSSSWPFQLQKRNGFYELRLIYRVDGRNKSEFKIPEAYVRRNGDQYVLLSQKDLELIDDSHWRLPIDPRVYLVHPQPLDLNDTIHRLLNSTPIAEAPINGDTFRYLAISQGVCHPENPQSHMFDVVVVVKSNVAGFQRREVFRRVYGDVVNINAHAIQDMRIGLWFHRNPYKASGRPNFDLGQVATTIPARMVCSQMMERRQTLMKMFEDLGNSREAMIEATNQYISLLMGLVTAPDSNNDFDFGDGGSDADDSSGSEEPEPSTSDVTEKTKKDKGGKKKREKKSEKSQASELDRKKLYSLRRLVLFTWTNSLDIKHKAPITLRDANFELICILFNLALWFSKHAAKIASNSNIEMEQAVEVYKSLRNAAGLFEYIKKDLLGNMKVTIARAMELKHDPGIIAPLACETATLYEKCRLGLQNIPEALVSKWRAYCIFKTACFRAYAHCFYSESELKADRCSMAIASAQEALKYCTQAQNAAKVYRSGSGAEFCFIRRLQPYAQRTLTKAQTENAMIYHQKALAAMPQLRLKASFGIATPELPQGLSFNVDESWQEAMPGFDPSKVAEWMTRKDYNSNQKEAEKLRSIPEAPIYQASSPFPVGSPHTPRFKSMHCRQTLRKATWTHQLTLTPPRQSDGCIFLGTLINCVHTTPPITLKLSRHLTGGL
ncbi:BRO1 domain-containing protein BROX [Taenia crassiceps]|uniref:BRO1 domain-containing protein BROX n=1 Tax=Taenia crassiceps TaxID=6207 RepID=A0ABR4Q4S2_9CEST